METLLALFVGIGLSAACGFRVFVPLFFVTIAALSGHVELAPEFAWMGTKPACIAFGSATLLEILAYQFPWLDHLFDTLAYPTSMVAGTLLTAAFLPEMSPFLKWSLAAMVGGSVAGAAKGGAILVRSASSISTAGIANPLLTLLETIGSGLSSGLALTAPTAMIILCSIATLCLLLLWRKKRKALNLHKKPLFLKEALEDL